MTRFDVSEYSPNSFLFVSGPDRLILGGWDDLVALSLDEANDADEAAETDAIVSTEVASDPDEGTVGLLALHPSNGQLALAMHHHSGSQGTNHAFLLNPDGPLWCEARRLPMHPTTASIGSYGDLEAMAWSPEGKQLAALGPDGLLIWHLANSNAGIPEPRTIPFDQGGSQSRAMGSIHWVTNDIVDCVGFGRLCRFYLEENRVQGAAFGENSGLFESPTVRVGPDVLCSIKEGSLDALYSWCPGSAPSRVCQLPGPVSWMSPAERLDELLLLCEDRKSEAETTRERLLVLHPSSGRRMALDLALHAEGPVLAVSPDGRFLAANVEDDDVCEELEVVEANLQGLLSKRGT